MAAHPLVLGVADALLAPYCERIQLHIGMFRRLCPGETASPGVEPGGTCERLGLGYPLVIEHSHGIDGPNQNRWFTVLNSRVIFHGKLLVITRW